MYFLFVENLPDRAVFICDHRSVKVTIMVQSCQDISTLVHGRSVRMSFGCIHQYQILEIFQFCCASVMWSENNAKKFMEMLNIRQTNT